MPQMPSTKAEVRYPRIEAIVCDGVSNPAIDYDKMRNILHWEDEEEYKARVRGVDKTNGKKGVLGFGDDYLLKDVRGKKVRCWNNTRNRPFGEPWALSIAQDILSSGPLLPFDKRRWKMNGESFIIGKYGQVLSGQHRGIGLCLAVQLWDQDPEAYPSWPTRPTLQTIIVTGIEEDQSTTRTMDNVKPRSLSDVFYTSDLFRDLGTWERKECTRYLANAVDLLWKRTGVSTKYQTHGESCDFLDRHSHILEMVRKLFDENKNRAISLMRLMVGNCAALGYLMAACKSDPDGYQSLRSESALDFSMMGKVRQFWVELAAGLTSMQPVRDALGFLVDPDGGGTGRAVEKHAIIAKAWDFYSAGKKFTAKDLELQYGEDDRGNMKLIEFPTVGGIDLGDNPDAEEPEGPPPTPEQIEAAKAEERKRRVADLEAKARQGAATKKGGK